MINDLMLWINRRRVHRQTVKELNSLSDHELYDLGIDRSMIYAIADEATYGKEAPVFNFVNWFKTKTDKEQIESYLADSASLEDLERRQRLINRGEAPWQVRANQNLKGWV